MTDKHKHFIWFICGLVALLFLFSKFGDKKVSAMPEEAAQSPNEPFYAPYYYPSPGIYPESLPFESTVNVYVDGPSFSLLSNQYIPIFGLVGMTAVGIQ